MENCVVFCELKKLIMDFDDRIELTIRQLQHDGHEDD